MAKKVGRKLTLKSIWGKILRGGQNASVVKEHMQFVPVGKEVFGGLAHGGKRAEIKREEMDLASRIGGLQCLDCLLSFGLGTPSNNHFGVCGEQSSGSLVSDASTCSGNHDRFSTQIMTSADFTGVVTSTTI